MPTSKPTVTDEHKQKYERIMGTVVKSAAPEASANAATIQNSRMNALLASLPKPKGIGDKMFIFTGKKKIIVDGKDREEEKVKTVDPAKLEHEKKELEKKEDEAKKLLAQASKPVETKMEGKTPSTNKEHSEVKIIEATKKPAEKITDMKKKTSKTMLIAITIFLGLGVWTFVWMLIFGYIPLPS